MVQVETNPPSAETNVEGNSESKAVQKGVPQQKATSFSNSTVGSALVRKKLHSRE